MKRKEIEAIAAAPWAYASEDITAAIRAALGPKPEGPFPGARKGKTAHEVLMWFHSHMPQVSLDIIAGSYYREGRAVAYDHPALVAALAGLRAAGRPEAEDLAHIMGVKS